MSQLSLRQKPADKARREDQKAVNADAVVARLATMRPAEIDAYVDQALVGLPSAKPLIKALAKAVALLLRER